MQKEIEDQIMKRAATKRFWDKFFQTAIYAVSLIAFIPLFWLLFVVMQKGLSQFSFSFFTELPPAPGDEGGGIVNALLGSLQVVLIAVVFSVPLSLAISVYISEIKSKKFRRFMLTLNGLLQGVPSIVVGIVVYLWVVKNMGQFSALSGGIALGLMMIPYIITTTVELLMRVPIYLKEAAFSLGAPHYKTVLKVLLPSVASGIINGILLAVARVAGETAPLLFTAFGNPFINLNPLLPVASLTQNIFQFGISPYERWQELAWGVSAILLLFILCLNLITKLVSKRWKIQF